MERRVVHINITNFMATIEEARDPSLRARPFIIAAEGQARASVLGISDIAYSEGIRPGMPLSLAQKRLPRCPVIPPDPELYETAQSTIYELACRFSPMVELRGGGHLFVDMTGMGRLFGYSIDAAAKLKHAYQSSLGLDPTTALAVNKVVSKVATRVVRPHGFASVPPGAEGTFMEPQPVSLLPGVGPQLLSRMGALGVLLMGELAHLSDAQALSAFGPRGTTLKRHALGLDTEPVHTNPKVAGSLTFSRILSTDSNDPALLRAHLILLAEQTGYAMRGQNRSTGRIQLTLQYSDMKSYSRQMTRSPAISTDREIYGIAKILLEQLLARRVRVRKLTLTLSRLHRESQQLDLFAPPREEAMQHAVDLLRQRYGKNCLISASALGAQPQ